MKKGRSGNAYKNAYKAYKLENRSEKNKIRKLSRHCKTFPEDIQAAEALKKIQTKGYNRRTKPRVLNSNPTIPKNKLITFTGRSKTAGEQLSTLFGIPIKYIPNKPGKTTVTYKKRKNVKP